MRKNKLTAVRLLQKHDHYSAGEIAGFPKEEVEMLIKNKIAELYRPPKARRKLGEDKQATNNDDKSYITK